MTEFRPHSYLKDFDRLDAELNEDSDYDSETEKSAPVVDDDEWNDVDDDRQTKRTNKRNQDKAEHWKQVQ